MESTCSTCSKTDIAESEASYRQNLRAYVRGLWSGVFSELDFIDGTFYAIQREFPLAWAEGAAACGIRPAEYSDEEKAALKAAIDNELIFTIRFANDIHNANKAAGGKLAPLFQRVELWVTRRNQLVIQARTTACANVKLMWMLGPTERHCGSCSKLNGKVKRGDDWRKANILPGSRDLECRGYHCLCQLVRTDAPLSRGPLPKIP